MRNVRVTCEKEPFCVTRREEHARSGCVETAFGAATEVVIEPALGFTVQIVLNDFGPLERVYQRTHYVKIFDARATVASIHDERMFAVRFSREQP